MLAVLPAHYRLDFYALRTMSARADVRLAAEHEFSGLYPECETGAMAPFGTLYHQPVYVDESLDRRSVHRLQRGHPRGRDEDEALGLRELARPVFGRIAIETTH